MLFYNIILYTNHVIQPHGCQMVLINGLSIYLSSKNADQVMGIPKFVIENYCTVRHVISSEHFNMILKRGYSPFCASVLLITKVGYPMETLSKFRIFRTPFELKLWFTFIYKDNKPEKCQIFS